MELDTKSDLRLIFSVGLVFFSECSLYLSSTLRSFLEDESAGGSDDWAKGVGHIKYVYTVELRPSDDLNDVHSHFAFMLPSTFIQPVGQETYAGVKEFLRSLIGPRMSKASNKT